MLTGPPRRPAPAQEARSLRRTASAPACAAAPTRRSRKSNAGRRPALPSSSSPSRPDLPLGKKPSRGRPGKHGRARRGVAPAAGPRWRRGLPDGRPLPRGSSGTRAAAFAVSPRLGDLCRAHTHTHPPSRHTPQEPRAKGAPHDRDTACAADPPAGPLGQKGISPATPPYLPRSPYLPIIVECCCTAASSSLSRIVHSPIAVHPETKTLASGGDLFTSSFLFPLPPLLFFFFFSVLFVWGFFAGGGKTNRRAAPLYRPQSSGGKAAGGGSSAEDSWLRWTGLCWVALGCAGIAWAGLGAPRRPPPAPARSAAGAVRRGGPAAWREEGWLLMSCCL